MEKLMTLVLVTGAWIIVTAVLGFVLARKAKPQGIALKIIHGILSLPIIGGVISCSYQLQLIVPSPVYSYIAIYLMGTAVCIKLISGLLIAFTTPPIAWLP